MAEPLAALVESLHKRLDEFGRDLAAVAAIAKHWDGQDTVDVFQKTSAALIDSPRFQTIMADITELRLRSIAKNVDGWFGKPFLNNRDAAKMIGITPQALSAMRKRHEGPKWSGSGKWVRYERTTIEHWLRDLPTR